MLRCIIQYPYLNLIRIHIYSTIHIKERICSEHNSLDKLTKISDIVYDPTAVSNRWNNFISEIMSGNMEKAKFLQKIFGYGLTRDIRHECMTILYGASIHKGKGTLCESALKVLDQAKISIVLQEFDL